MPNNPGISILSLEQSQISELGKLSPAKLDLSPRPNESRLGCESAAENFCWLKHRVTSVEIRGDEFPRDKEIKLEAMSPWENQVLIIKTAAGKTIEKSLAQAGIWTEISLPPERSFEFQISKVRSPPVDHTSGDTRRLGIALRAKQ